jgi:hypothetical protein
MRRDAHAVASSTDVGIADTLSIRRQRARQFVVQPTQLLSPSLRWCDSGQWHQLCCRSVAESVDPLSLKDVLMVRHVFIVSRKHPLLYEYLLERFEDDPNVAVILDRRLGERRNSDRRRTEQRERRTADRRRPVPVDDDLQLRSHYIVEL